MEYVISDIHGSKDELTDVLDKIAFCKSDTLYVLGDSIDKGVDSFGVLKVLESLGDNAVILRGNHEEMMLDYFDHRGKWHPWINSAKCGASTLRSASIDSMEVKKAIRFMRSFQRIIETPDAIMSHAGVDIVDDQLDIRDKHKCIWGSNILNIENTSEIKKTIIFGHVNTSSISKEHTGKIWKHIRPGCEKMDNEDIHKYDKICIDTGVCNTGILGCLRLNDMMEIYATKKYRIAI